MIQQRLFNLMIIAAMVGLLSFLCSCDENLLNHHISSDNINSDNGLISYTGEEINFVPVQSPTTKKWGYTDPITGEQVIPCQFESANKFCEGLAAVQLNGKCGYIDHNGNFAIPCKYNKAGDFSKGIAEVNCDGANHHINRHGNIYNPDNNGYCCGGSHHTGNQNTGNQNGCGHSNGGHRNGGHH